MDLHDTLVELPSHLVYEPVMTLICINYIDGTAGRSLGPYYPYCFVPTFPRSSICSEPLPCIWRPALVKDNAFNLSLLNLMKGSGGLSSLGVSPASCSNRADCYELELETNEAGKRG